ncbi:MAG: FtsX-like permease family protein [Nitrososphaerota archaeon]|nr:FtsX-like permease family protein [Candidatus Bathyarchaeota archaeon]MDW8048605.1 FtsX-like permease family protein [Nitrososphaerota archaeon]
MKRETEAPKTEKSSIAIEKVGTVTFPISEAFRYCLESIRKRFTRALITALSILLGIAFMVTVLTMRIVLIYLGQPPPAAYQQLMVIIALLVCGVGIVNSMLMSVTERIKEIGTIKCLGATDTNVLEIFLIEALLLGLLGGVIGSVAGWVAAIGIYGAQFGFGKFPIIAPDYFINIGLGIGVAALLSVLSAAYPAFYAARLKPAEALRYEI